ncbi:MAG: stage III sporulation protein AE [Lachnospiraceae bacterium]|nr:stage III sporulation protein AE [Lachnospiraceae bacterium]
MKQRMWKVCVIAFLMITFFSTKEIFASQEDTNLLDLYDFSEVDEKLEKYNQSYSFQEIVTTLMQGDFSQSLSMVKEEFIDLFFQELLYHKYAMIKIMILAVISAMFTNLSLLIEKTDISEMGFFITYILMATSLIESFRVILDMVYEVTDNITGFIEIVIPSMVLSVGLCSGQATALGFGEIALFLIYAGEIIIRNILLPAVLFYVIIMIINNLMKEDYLSKFGGVFKGFVLWFLKCFTGLVMGLNLIKGMILPGVDSAGKNTVVKIANLIPGMEDFTSAGSVFMSSAVIVKNAVGGAVILILVLIVAVPCIKMLVFVVTYKITAALIQPMTDGRISGCVDATATGVLLLNKVVITQVIMLSLSVAILCIVTN